MISVFQLDCLKQSSVWSALSWLKLSRRYDHIFFPARPFFFPLTYLNAIAALEGPNR